jgi:hypothetical protein
MPIISHIDKGFFKECNEDERKNLDQHSSRTSALDFVLLHIYLNNIRHQNHLQRYNIV